MKRVTLIGLLCLLSSLTYAGNRLFYLRYDQACDNYPAIIRYVRSIKDTTKDRFVLFYDNKLYEGDKIINLFNSQGFLANDDVYYYKTERDIFLQKVSRDLLEERVVRGHIKGSNDAEWEIYFLVHKDSDVDQLCNYINAAEYNQRLAVHYLQYDKNGKIIEVDYGTFSRYIKTPITY